MRRPNFLAAALHFVVRPDSASEAVGRSDDKLGSSRPKDRSDFGGPEDLCDLFAEYEGLATTLNQAPDAYWQISVRWSFGRCLGWFVERGGYLEHGPYRSQFEAEASMRALLVEATSVLREDAGS